ncbi:MAG: SCO family protein [Bacteroidota bacterium]|nr:SCO family protein [Bacteroidota bacterium]
MIQKQIKWIVLFLLLILPGIIYFYITKGSNNFVNLEIIGPEGHEIPAFKFVNQFNDTITNLDYEDNIYVTNFFFTSCPTICPIMTYNMRNIQQELSVYPNIKFLSFTVDPDNDTPERLLYYAREMRINLENWNLVTGRKQDIYSMAPFYFANASADSLAPGGFLHSEYFVLVDKQGKVRSGVDNNGNVVGVYDGTKDLDIKDLINDIKVLMAEYNKPTKNED